MHAKISHENGKHSFSQSAKSARYAWNGAKEISSRTQCHSLGTTGNFLRCSSCQHWHLYCTAVFRDHWNILESQIVNNMTAIKIYSLHFPLFQEIRCDFFLIIAATASHEVTSSIERFSKCVSLCNNVSPLSNPFNENSMVLPSQHLHDPSLVTSCNAEKDPKFCMIFCITVLLN